MMPLNPDRLVRLQGASNFRDLGGYPGRDGRELRWRRLFRSDHLGALTAADRDALAKLGLVKSFDFRGQAERAATPYVLSGLQQHSLAIEPTVAQRMHDVAAAGKALTPALAAELMKELYRMLVGEQAPRFAELFEHLLDTDAPMVFHCTAGKDRTGVAAALILLALGVERGLVVQDYLLTNRYYQGPRAPRDDIAPDVLAVLWNVQQGFLEAALEVIDREHGGIESYLAQRIRLSPAARAALADRYLQRRAARAA